MSILQCSRSCMYQQDGFCTRTGKCMEEAWKDSAYTTIAYPSTQEVKVYPLSRNSMYVVPEKDLETIIHSALETIYKEGYGLEMIYNNLCRTIKEQLVPFQYYKNDNQSTEESITNFEASNP